MGQGESGFAESLIWGIFPSMMQGIYRMLVVFFLFGYVSHGFTAGVCALSSFGGSFSVVNNGDQWMISG